MKALILKETHQPVVFDDYENRGTAAKEAEMNILKNMNWGGDSKLYPEVLDELKTLE